MALDPSIILAGKQAQLPTLQDLVQLRNLGQQGKLQSLQLDAATKGAADARTLSDLYRQNTDPTTGQLNVAGMQAAMAQGGLGAEIPKFQQTALSAQKAGTDAEGSALDLNLKKLNHVGGVLGSLIQKPDLSHSDVIGAVSSLVDQNWITAQQGAQMVQTLPGPGQLKQFLVTKGLETQDFAKQLEATRPKYDEQDRGGTINQGTIDPITGVRTAGASVAKSATPDEVARDNRIREAATGKGYTQEEGALFGALAEAGISLPAGLRSKEQMKATAAALLARNPGLTPDEIAQKIGTGQIDFKAEGKETQTAAAQAGKIAVAQNEIKAFVPLAREALAALPRGSFVPFNKLRQMTDAQLGDPQLAAAKGYMQTLSNAYDALAARGGTDKEKRAHNRELFDTANSPEAATAIFDVMLKEAEAADTAAVAATHRRGAHAAPTTPGAPPGADVPADIAALLAKHGGK